MGFLSGVLLVFFVIDALLLIGIVLIQDESGDGVGGMFGGGSSTPFGSRSGNILTRVTGILGLLFFVLCFGFLWTTRVLDDSDVLGAARRANADAQAQNWWENTSTATDAEVPADAEAVTP